MGHRLFALTAVLGFTACAIAVAGGDDRPRELRVASAGLSAKGAQGSYCVDQPGVRQCADYLYPLEPRGRLPVKRGRRVLLLTGDDKITKVTVRLVRVRGNGFEYTAKVDPVRRVPGRNRIWRFEMPEDARGNVIDVFARYRGGGDSNWWAGLKLRD